jgi:hypothetical protein
MKAVVVGALAAILLTGQPLGAKAGAGDGGHFYGSHSGPGMVRGQQPLKPFALPPLRFPHQPWMAREHRSFRSGAHADRSHGGLYDFDGGSKWSGGRGHADHSRSGLYDFESNHSWLGRSGHSVRSHSGLYDFDGGPASPRSEGRTNRSNSGLYDFDAAPRWSESSGHVQPHNLTEGNISPRTDSMEVLLGD